MNTHVDPTAVYRLKASVMESRLGDETVLLHLERGIYFGLDPFGTRLWERIKAGSTVDDLLAATRQEFPNAPETVEDDLYDFIRQLLANELIERH